MGQSWLQRLVVRGPASEITAFRRAVASPDQPVYVTMKPECRTQRLSFTKMAGLLPRHRVRKFEADIEEPWDLVVEPPRPFKDGSREVTYKFQLSTFEPEELIITVSRLYPWLCFVIGCVACDMEVESSRLVHNGRSWRWRLPVGRGNAIWKKLVPEETEDNSDDVFWGVTEAEWQIMDEVVAHWQPRMDALMARVLKKHRAAHTRAPGCARRRRRGKK